MRRTVMNTGAPDRTLVRTFVRWLPAAIGLIAGVAAGYVIGYNLSVGGCCASFTAAFVGFGVAGVVAILVIIAVLAALTKRSRLSREALRVAAALAGGAIVLSFAIPGLGLGYKAPVTLEASGSGSITLIDVDGFQPTGDGSVTCQSVQDSTEVSAVVFLALGELNGGTLRSWMFLPRGDESDGKLELIIDGADLPEGSAQPIWTGTATFETTDGGLSGTSTFAGLLLRFSPPDAAPTTGWPTTLTGTMTWQCLPWPEPGTR